MTQLSFLGSPKPEIGGEFLMKDKSPFDLQMEAHDLVKWAKALPSAAACKKVIPMEKPAFEKMVIWMAMRGSCLQTLVPSETTFDGGGSFGRRACNSRPCRRWLLMRWLKSASDSVTMNGIELPSVKKIYGLCSRRRLPEKGKKCWRKKRRCMGQHDSQSVSRKVRGMAVGAMLPGGGDTLPFSRTLVV
ncbi:hypothetical protein V6N13_048375 [Hibiscus sabdariffa]